MRKSLNLNMNENNVGKQELYPCSSRQRPQENVSGGYGMHCCIPECNSFFYDRNWEKTGIGFFKFPKDEQLRKKWLKVIGRFRRKGGADSFKVTDSTAVCEFHFKTDEIRVSLGIGRKNLVPGSIPNVFSFEAVSTSSSRKPPKRRAHMFDENSSDEGNNSNVFTDLDDIPDVLGEPVCSDCEKKEEDIVKLVNRIQELEEQIKHVELENIYLKEENNSLTTKYVYSHENISKSPEIFKSATGLDVSSFHLLYDFLNPGANSENIKFYETSARESTTPHTTGRDPEYKKSGPRPKLVPIEQLFLFMTWLKNGFSLTHTSWLFCTPKSTVSRYIITWTNFLYFSLGSVPVWPSRKQVDESMPESFKRTYATTRCIIDCTELFCQRPSALATQSCLYSHYKSHVTYKGLIGIAPSGAVTFVSQLYDGSISDKEIVKRSGILNSKLWDKNDSIMADRGFTIQEDLEPLGVHLNIPAFLGGREQLTAAEVKESQTIASVRIHVERAIQRVKKFRQIRNEIPLILHGSINQLWTVCCLLCNALPPLIQKDPPKERDSK